MALSLPSIPSLLSFLPDSVGIYTQSYVQVFKNARPTKVTVRATSRLMEHPLETGSTIIDHVIQLPIEIEMILILNRNEYYNTYQLIQQLYQNNTILIIKTRASVYSNMIIEEIPHEETAETFNTINMMIRFREAQFAPPATNVVVPLDPLNSDTVDRGVTQGSNLVPNVNVRFLDSSQTSSVGG